MFKRITLFLTMILLAFGSLLAQRSDEVFAQKFVEAVQKKDAKAIKMMMPGVAEWKELAPEATDGLSDDQISAKMQGNIHKVLNAFHEMQSDARHYHVHVKDLEYKMVKNQQYMERNLGPQGLEIVFDYGHSIGTFSLTAIEMHGQWFLLEIEEPHQVFATIKGEKKKGPLGFIKNLTASNQ